MSAMADLYNDMQAAQALMDNQQDDLTIVYMWASKQAEKKANVRIKKLEGALQAAMEDEPGWHDLARAALENK